MQMSAGHHEFKFMFNLPHQLPTSFESFYGTIRYQITVEMQRKLKFNYSFRFPLTIISQLNLNAEHQELQQPVRMETSKRFLFSLGSGALAIATEIPLSGLVGGQTLPVCVTINNESNVDVVAIHAELVRHCHYKSTFVSSKDCTTKVATCEAVGVAAGTKNKLKLLLTIPSVVPTDEKNCSLIKIAYFILVTAKVGGLYRNVKLKIPVVVGVIPYENCDKPPSYRSLCKFKEE